ncbi:FkbM family methyltransferase [Verrucomicrobiota bacterium]
MYGSMRVWMSFRFPGPQGGKPSAYDTVVSQEKTGKQMRGNEVRTIYKKLSKRGFEPAHAAEVGVYRPEAANIYNYIVQGVRCTLVEPDPDSVRQIKERFSCHENVTLHPVAAYDFNGELDLFRRGASTYVSELRTSPAITNDEYTPNPEDRFSVQAIKFNEIDDGTIDLLSVDAEGSEWFVIKHMDSRPAVISLETHGAAYTNPCIAEIKEWMAANNYVLWYKDKTDSVFVKYGSIEIGILDRISLMVMDAYLAIRNTRKRKRIRRALRNRFQRPGFA